MANPFQSLFQYGQEWSGRLVDLLGQLSDASVPAGGTSAQVLAKASNADYDTGWVDAGGGSQTVESVITDLNFDTPGLVTKTFDITALDQGAQKLTIAGDHRTLFPVAAALRVVGSTGNDGTYTVDTVTFTGGNTEIVTVETLPDGTVDGVAANSGTAGITVAHLGVGDVLLGSYGGSVSGQALPCPCFLFSPTPWDGTSPVLYFSTAAQRANVHSIAIEQQSLDNNADADYYSDGVLFDNLPNNGITNANFMNINGPIRAAEAVDLVVLVDDNNGGDPGSTVGAAILVLQILRA